VAQSKDLRLLAHLGAALLWTEGLAEFVDTLKTAAAWLEQYWSEVYPLLDGDAVERRNALNCLADPRVVLERLSHLPLADSPRHGKVSLATIKLAATPPEVRGDITAEHAAVIQATRQGAIQAAFEEVPLEHLVGLEAAVAAGLAALTSIEARMRDHGGPDAAPKFEDLQNQFDRIRHVVREQIAVRDKAQAMVEAKGDGPETGLEPAPEPASTTVSVGPAAAAFAGGAITSRQDAIRALDAVAEFFRRHEPSSPVPLFVDRAKRLVSKNFLEVLADVAPDALPGARTAGGLKSDQ